jgi:hypothetical protein
MYILWYLQLTFSTGDGFVPVISQHNNGCCHTAWLLYDMFEHVRHRHDRLTIATVLRERHQNRFTIACIGVDGVRRRNAGGC